MSLPHPVPGGVVIVTGASSGIGAELARELAARGHDLVLVARREDRLRELAEELRGDHGRDVLVHPADLTDRAAREGLLGAVADAGRTVSGLCNNAGYGLAGLAWERDLAQSRDMIELNVVALHDLTLHVVPEMVRAGTGAVLNVASVAAYQPLPGMAAYAATKAFVHAFSEALHEELGGHRRLRHDALSRARPDRVRRHRRLRSRGRVPGVHDRAAGRGRPAGCRGDARGPALGQSRDGEPRDGPARPVLPAHRAAAGDEAPAALAHGRLSAVPARTPPGRNLAHRHSSVKSQAIVETCTGLAKHR